MENPQRKSPETSVSEAAAQGEAIGLKQHILCCFCIMGAGGHICSEENRHYDSSVRALNREALDTATFERFST